MMQLEDILVLLGNSSRYKKAHLHRLLATDKFFTTQFAAKLAAAAAAEEGGEENVVPPAMGFEWRIQVPGLTIPGESADDHLPFIKELAAFEGNCNTCALLMSH